MEHCKDNHVYSYAHSVAFIENTYFTMIAFLANNSLYSCIIIMRKYDNYEYNDTFSLLPGIPAAPGRP